MPTPAHDALVQSSDLVQQQADLVEIVLEEHISRGATRVHLLQGRGTGGFILGTGSLPQGTTLPALQVVKQRYEEVGWTVRIMNHQFDGIGITISAEGPA